MPGKHPLQGVMDVGGPGEISVVAVYDQDLFAGVAVSLSGVGEQGREEGQKDDERD